MLGVKIAATEIYWKVVPMWKKGDVPLSSEVLVSKWIMHVFCKDDIWWSYTDTENLNSGCELQYCQWPLAQKDKTTDIVITICETL